MAAFCLPALAGDPRPHKTSCDQYVHVTAPGATVIRYASRLAGNCLNTHKTEVGSEQQTAQSSLQRLHTRALRSLTTSLSHAQALLRRAKRRPLLAFSLALGAVSAVSTVGVATAVEAIHIAHNVAIAVGVAPLAPAPPPPPAPVASIVAATQHKNHLLGFPLNPLRGLASWYGAGQGRHTASGERFNPQALTAAHRRLPFGTIIRVTNTLNGRSVELRINDRGPWVHGRILDVTDAAADVLQMKQQGTVPVLLEVLALGPPSKHAHG